MRAEFYLGRCELLGATAVLRIGQLSLASIELFRSQFPVSSLSDTRIAISSVTVPSAVNYLQRNRHRCPIINSTGKNQGLHKSSGGGW